MEEWRTSCFSNEYSVSNMGNVKRNSTGRIYNGVNMYMGYRRLCVIIEGKRKVINIAREVLSAFHNPYPNQIIEFKDGNKSNCKLQNLKWICIDSNGLINNNFQTE